MSYYYPGQSTAVSTASTPALPSPSNLDISCIIDPVGGKNGLYVGNITAATNHEMLMSTNICDLVNGIKAMLTSAMEANFIPDSSVTPYYLKVPALDYPAFSLDPYFEQAADFINQNISLTNVLVHCMAGVSRSVSFVIAYLMKYRRMTFDDALILMRSRRSIVISINM
jgi:protein-tyrosine phosphatase